MLNRPIPNSEDGQATEEFPLFGVLTCNGSYDTLVEKPGQFYAAIDYAGILQIAVNPGSALTKEHAKAIIPSVYRAHDGREHAAQRERGEFAMLTVDIDTGNIPLDAVVRATTAIVGPNAAFLVYSSGSASAEVQKWRVIIPLADTIFGEYFTSVQLALFSLYAGHGIQCDRALSRPGQLVYLPNIAPKRRDTQGVPLFYQHHINNGAPIALPTATVIINRTKEMQRQAREARAQAEAEAAARREARQAERQKSGAHDEQNPRDWFNQTTSVEEMLLRYGWKTDKRGHWQSPFQKSGSYATVITDDGMAFTSMSQSDLDANLGAVSQAGHCYGDAYDIYVKMEFDNDHTTAWREIRRGMPKTERKPDLSSFDTVEDDAEAIIASFRTKKERQEREKNSGAAGSAGGGGAAPGQSAGSTGTAGAEAKRPPIIINPFVSFTPPVFPLHVTPTWFQDFVSQTAEAKGVDVGVTAMLALAGIGVARNTASRIVIREGNGWTEATTFWLMMVGDPSSRKSPVFNTVTAPLASLEQRAGDDYRHAKAIWKANGKVGDEPTQLHYGIQDATVEALQQMLANQERGVAVVNDELSSFFEGLSRYKAGSDRAFYLMAYNGGPRSIHRVGRGDIPVNNIGTSILGGIQPDVLKEHRGSFDGLMERFLYVKMTPATVSKNIDNRDGFLRYSELVKAVAKAPPMRIHLPAEADDLITELDAQSIAMSNPDIMGKEFAGWNGKTVAHWARILGAVHGLRHGGQIVTMETVEATTEIFQNYVLRSAAAVYGDSLNLDPDTKALALYILAKGLRKVVPGEITSAVREFRPSKDDRRKALDRVAPHADTLEGLGWLTPIEDEQGRVRSWTVRANLSGLMPLTAAQERERRAKAREIISKIGILAKEE